MGRFDNLVEQIKTIDVETINEWNSTDTPEMKVIEEQKVYFWIRLYLKEENESLEIGDTITITYTPSGESLDTLFSYYSKQGLMKDHNEEIVNYTGEDDTKILCLMVDEKVVNHSNDIPFIRTLFKISTHYEYQLVRRGDLTFTVKRNGELLDYYDCDF